MPARGLLNKEFNFSREHPQYVEMIQRLRAYQVAVNEAAIVSITDTGGNIIYVNQKFTEISKYTAEELLGKNHRIINSGFHDKEFFAGMWKEITAGRSWRGEIKNKAKDGSYYWVDTIITPITDRNGIIIQYLSIRNLITSKKENEERLLHIQDEIVKRKRQLIEAQKVAKTGSWFLSASGEHRLEWSDETYHIFEIAPGTAITYEGFLERVHPDDRNLVDKSWKQGLKTGIYHIEHRIITSSGEKWVSERAHFEFEKGSDIKSALGTVQDITERKKIEDSLRESKDIYKTLFNKSPFAIGIVDKYSLRFLEVNETATRLYGYTSKEFRNLSLFDIRVPQEHNQLTDLLMNGRYTGDRSIRCHRKKNGEILNVEPAINSITYKGKDVFLITIHDVTEKLRIEQDLNMAEHNRQKGIIEAEEKSRSHIGMELHDNVNQLLVAARIYFQRVETIPGKSKEYLKTGMDIISSALQEIRQLSASLVTPVLSNSLKGAIEDLVGSYALLHTEIRIEKNIHFTEEAVSAELKINIYRIIQELLSNIVKHAQATAITITLIQHQDLIELEVADNGKGFEPDQPKGASGLPTSFTERKHTEGKYRLILQ